MQFNKNNCGSQMAWWLLLLWQSSWCYCTIWVITTIKIVSTYSLSGHHNFLCSAVYRKSETSAQISILWKCPTTG